MAQPDPAHKEREVQAFCHGIDGYDSKVLMHCEFCRLCTGCGRRLRKFWPGRRFGHKAGRPRRGDRIDVP